MKFKTIIIAIFGLIACKNQTDKTVVYERNETVQIDNSNINGAVSKPYKEYSNCNFDNFIADEKTPRLAKDIYLDNDWNLNNDIKALALLDSITAKNKDSRPFYFKVVTKSYEKSDGYYSEALGLTGKEFIENNSKEFISYFDNKECFSENDLTTWAKIIILEFCISSEGEYDKPIIDDFIKKLKSNCKDCSLTQKENINKFGLSLKKEWEEFLKNIN